MRELNIKEIREVQLTTLIKVTTFCEENNIRYSLCGGTLIGAVRHKGYIPWDDDIDIMMPRPDYDKLMSLFEIDGLELFHHTKYTEYNYPFAKISDVCTKVVELDYDYTQSFGIHIDVFPIDGFPEKRKDQRKHISSINRYRRTLYRKLRVKRKNLVKQIYHNIIISRYSFQDLNRNITETATKYSFGKSKYAGISVWGYREKEICRIELYDSTMELDFEGYKFKAIVGYDEYLTTVYGDYMQLPPEDKRVPMHNFIAYKI